MQRAIQSNNAHEIRRLCKTDAESLHVPVKTPMGADLPLHYAVKSGCSLDVIEALLEGGARVTDRGASGESILSAMVKADADAEKAVNQFPSFPMFAFPSFPDLVAAQRDLHIAPPQLIPSVNIIMEMCCQEEASTEVEDKLISIASCLLQSGADPLQLEADGKCAADHADLGSRRRLAQLLRHHGDLQVARAVKQQRLLRRLPADVEGSVLGFLLPPKWV